MLWPLATSQHNLMTIFIERALPKVNLTLRVAGKRADGYHALESLVAFAQEPADLVTHDLGKPEGVAVVGPGARAIVGENLIARAVRLACEAEPRLVAGHFTLEKHLPVAAGIGGGSADAAAVLRALGRANPEIAGAVDWAGIALKLGADVPVCVKSSPAFMWGIGERITELSGLPKLPAVIVNPMLPVPADKTAQVFRRLGAGALAADDAEPKVPGPFADVGALVSYMRGVGNDLERPAMSVVPAIAEIRAALSECDGCLIAQLSGGGPTCFGIFESAEAAVAAADRLKAAHPSWWIAKTALG